MEVTQAWPKFLAVLAQHSYAGTDIEATLTELCTELRLSKRDDRAATIRTALGEPNQKTWEVISSEVVAELLKALELADLSIKLSATTDGPKYEFFWKRYQDDYGWFVDRSFWAGFEKLLTQTQRKRRRNRHVSSPVSSVSKRTSRRG